MEVQELKHLIKAGDIPNFLIFTGEDWLIQQIYIKQISKTMGLGVKYIDTVSEVVRSMSGRSLLRQNFLFCVRDDKEFMTEEKLQRRVIDNLGNNVLILQLTSVDKRLKLLKTYTDRLVEFPTLKPEVLKQYIQKEIYLSDRNTEILMEVCEYNYGRCLLEIDKIKRYLEDYNYGNSNETDANQVFSWLLKDGTIYQPPKEALWDFIKAVLQNKPKLAFDLWYDLKTVNAPTLSILSNLFNTTKQVLQVQTCKSKDITKTTGLTGWQIRNAKECTGIFRAGDLVYLLRLIQRVESGIKSGKIEESVAVDYVLTSFL